MDVGEETVRTIASGLRSHYSANDLVGRKVLVVANLKERTMMGFKSMGMILCCSSPDHGVRILEPTSPSLPVGTRVLIGANGAMEPLNSSLLAKKKVLEQLLPNYRTDDTGRAIYLTDLFTAKDSETQETIFFTSNPPLEGATVA